MRYTRSACCARAASGHAAKQRYELAPPHARHELPSLCAVPALRAVPASIMIPASERRRQAVCRIFSLRGAPVEVLGQVSQVAPDARAAGLISEAGGRIERYLVLLRLRG
jgi:hypothetical protein